MNPFRLVALASLVFLAGCAGDRSSTPPTPPAPVPAPMPPPPAPVAPIEYPPSPQHVSSPYLFSDAPTATTYPNSWTVFTSTGYESAYDETLKSPVWVAYHLTGSAGTSAPRPSGYPTDTRSTAGVTAADFPPGYDHGHMAPNEAIAEFYGDAAQMQTFLMTNMVPQKPGLNRGPWKSLETQEYTTWEPEFHDVWVLDGPVYTTADDQPISPTNLYGTKHVPIPVACFKIIVAKDAVGNIKTLAFIMPQDPGTGHKPKEYLTSIREVERRTGLNFNSSWTTAKQDAVETTTASDLWK